MKKLKIVLSILFVAVLGFFVARSFIHPHRPALQVFPQISPAPAKKVVARPATPPVPAEFRMAIILDDWGENFSLTRQAIDIGRPLTLSVLPYLKYSKKIAEVAHENHLGVMLHMPMEPKKARERMEPQTILTTTPDADVVRYLDEALAGVPYAEGVNNHTGSKATCDRRVMKLVLGRLKELRLFFVDSFVTAESVGPEIAEETGIGFAKRNVFIDNKSQKDAILEELERAKKLAIKNGQVIVIGHDKKATLAAIKEAVPELEKAGVRLVFVKELIKAPFKK